MADFNLAIEAVIGFEGGYWDDPRGGPTKYGITRPTLEEAKRRGLVPRDRQIRDLTVPEAKTIYRVLYWNEVRGDEIRNQVIAGELLDTAVNCGQGTAVKLAQRALNFLGEHLVEDGILGPRTLEALNKWGYKDGLALFKAMNGEQYLYYKGITGITFPAGWMKRIQDYNQRRA